MTTNAQHVHVHVNTSGATDENGWHTLRDVVQQVNTMTDTITGIEANVAALTEALAAAQAATDIKQEALAAAFAALQDMLENGVDTARLEAVATQLEAALSSAQELTADIASTDVPDTTVVVPDPPVAP